MRLALCLAAFLFAAPSLAQDMPPPLPRDITASPSAPAPLGFTPVPDPTVLTTEQLFRAIASVRELIEAKLEGREKAIIARLDGNDKAIKLLQDTTDRSPQLVKEAVTQLQALHEAQFNEKFESIQTQFAERDVRVEQSSTATKIAVDAALQAAKEAVGAQNVSSAQAIAKSEAATAKQIDQIELLISTNIAALNGKIEDMKERLTTIESRAQGASTQKADANDSLGLIFGGIGALIGVGGVLIAVMRRPDPVVVKG